MTAAVDVALERDVTVVVGDPRDISSQLVLAMLEALVGVDGAVAVMAAVNLSPWATLGELSEAQAARLRREVVNRCAEPACQGRSSG